MTYTSRLVREKTASELQSLLRGAKWIDPELKHAPKERQRSSCLRKCFTLSDPADARLMITAHGIYDVYLNGTHVDGYLLAPGSSQYDKRLMTQEYDVTDLLREGENEIVVTLGDGWYRGCCHNELMTNSFGSDVALLCRLDVNGKAAFVSDETWEASQSGPLGKNDLMMGEEYDATREISDWHGVTVREYGYGNLIASGVPVAPHEEFKATVLKTPGGENVLDFGQNMAGFVTFSLSARRGQRIVMTHGETLDEGGNFTIQNFQNPRRPRCFQRVEYICRDGLNEYRPTKCYFGFRYVKVESDISLTGEEFTAAAIYSEMKQTGFFECGDERVNRLFQNALWSMKSNFVDVPTDCPTREKSGYSGDLVTFSHTAMYLMDCRAVIGRWIDEQAATQFDDGCVRQIAPCGGKRTMYDGGVGWSDSIVLVPWRMWKRDGDTMLIERNYDTIRKFMDFRLKNAARRVRFGNRDIPKELRAWFVDKGFLWGEWLEPGVDFVAQTRDIVFHGEPEIATAFLFLTCRAMSELADAIGKADDAKKYARAAQMARKAYRYRYVKDGKIEDTTRQCKYVRPLVMGLLDEGEKPLAAATLAKHIDENGKHLNTGFLSTHELCRVLTDNGCASLAYDLLLQEDYPGWLYPVTKGATTIPEMWDGFGEDGKVKGSFNHYSYGAVVGWLFDRAAGIIVENGSIIVAPHPDKRLGFLKAVYDSPFGEVKSAWRYEGETVEFEITIPEGQRAEVILPDGKRYDVDAGNHQYRGVAYGTV